MAERRVPHVVAEPDRLDEVFVEPQCPRHAARDTGRFQRVRHPGPVVIACRIDEDLRLALQAPERFRMQDPIAVALERRTQTAIVLRLESSACLVGTDCQRRQRPVFLLTNLRLEGVGDSSCKFGHLFQAR